MFTLRHCPVYEYQRAMVKQARDWDYGRVQPPVSARRWLLNNDRGD
jgi:hypothetical protein